MNQTYVLPTAVRLFKKSGGDTGPGNGLSQLVEHGQHLHLPEGTEVTLDEPKMMSYDHREQLAARIVNDGRWEIDHDIYLIIEEIGPLNAKPRSA